MTVKKIINTAFERKPGLSGTVVGACLGFLILRPYTLIMYWVYHLIEKGEVGFHYQIISERPGSFRFFMLFSSLSFVIFGGIIGLAFGKLYSRKQRHLREQIEREKRDAAIEALKEMNVTLSHYIINSSAIIKGFAQRGNRLTADEKIREYFSIIKDEADKSMAVIKGLESLREIEPVKYVDSGTDLMIDLRRQIEEQLKKLAHIEAGA